MPMLNDISNSFFQVSHKDSSRAESEAEYNSNRKSNEHNMKNGKLGIKETDTFCCNKDNLKENNSVKNKDNNDITTSQLNSHLQNTLEDLNLNEKSSIVRIKFESDSSQFINKAEVEVKCENSDLVVDKMLESIVKKFPPTSFVAVERTDVSDDGKSHTNNLLTNKVGLKMSCNEVPNESKEIDRSKAYNVVNSSCLHFSASPDNCYVNNSPYVMRSSLNYPYTSFSVPTCKKISNKNGNTDHANISINGTPSSRTVSNAWKTDINGQFLNDISKSDVEYISHFGVEEVIKPISKIYAFDVQRENMKYVPKDEKKIVERIVEFPSGEKFFVPCLYPVDVNFVTPKLVDKEVPVVLSQSVVPQLEETDEIMEVKVARYIPKYIPVEVYIPKPITIPLKSAGMEEKFIPYKLDVANDKAQKQVLQTLMDEMNPHLHQLELFNEAQKKSFDTVLLQSSEIAKENGFLPPPPIYESLRFCSEKGQLVKIENINLMKPEPSCETLDSIYSSSKKINNFEGYSNNESFNDEKQQRSNAKEKNDARNQNMKFNFFNINKNNFFMRNTNLFKSCMDGTNFGNFSCFKGNKDTLDTSRKNSNVSCSVASFGARSCSTNKEFIYSNLSNSSTTLQNSSNPTMMTKDVSHNGKLPTNMLRSSSFLELTRQSASQTNLNNIRRHPPPVFMSRSAFPLLICDRQVSAKSALGVRKSSLLSASKIKNNKNNVLSNIESRYIHKDSDNNKDNHENIKHNLNDRKDSFTNSKVAVLNKILRKNSLASSLNSFDSRVVNECSPVKFITVGQK